MSQLVMPTAVTRLSNDILMLIFERMLDIRKDKRWSNWNKQLLHVLFVCRQWNVSPFSSFLMKEFALMEILFRP
jgi:hypothetical protein